VLDDTGLKRHGYWQRSHDSSLYGGSQSASAKKAVALSLAGVRADRIALLVTTCKNCGTASLAGHRLGTISLASANTKHEASGQNAQASAMR
jgi:hypothetical protein